MSERLRQIYVHIDRNPDGCKCGPPCGFPCFQRVGLAPACEQCGCAEFKDEELPDAA